MAKLLKGYPLIKEMDKVLKERADLLRQKGVAPKLAIVRVGSKEDDLAYERSAVRRCENSGIETEIFENAPDIDTDTLLELIEKLNGDSGVHGILMFRPLPGHIDEKKVVSAINPEKDVDGCTPVNLYKVFVGDSTGYAPCTAQAVVSMLEYYNISIESSKITIVGRSMVVGRPLSMLLLRKNATVKICHTRTKDLKKEAKDSDILIVAAGRAEFIDKSYVASDMTVIDVGINVNEEGNLTGDVDFAGVEPLVKAISPVPKGVGGVTTAVLAENVIKSSEKAFEQSV